MSSLSLSRSPRVLRQSTPRWWRPRKDRPQRRRQGARRLFVEALEARHLLSSFSNTAPITIAFSGGAVSPYPSNISVSGLSGVVTDVNVTLHGFTHTYPDDVDILLVGPAGQNLIVLSDVGGSYSVTVLTLTLDDSASGSLPDEGLLTSGTFKPTNGAGEGDTFGAPAPAPSSATTLAVFNGSAPNGNWQLFVADNYPIGDGGSISGGWELNITTAAAPTDDFGDAPAPYPTLVADTGARHTVVAGFFLGSAADVETDGQPSSNAILDDTLGTPDDEDGVQFHDVARGSAATVDVLLTNTAGKINLDLDAWIDFNADGDWNDAGERIYSGSVSTGNNSLTFNVPADALAGFTFSRFRLHNGTTGLPVTGTADDGEVEDYRIEIIVPDTTPPTVTVANLITNDTTPAITGTVSHGTLQVLVHGQTYTAGDGNLTVSGTNWTLQIPAGDALSLGTYEVSAAATDVAGNVGTDATTNELRIVKLIVTSLSPTGSGFTARFSGPVDTGVLNLYDSAGGLLGAADVTLVGATVGPVRGSLILSDASQQITFVRTGGSLAADTYTVTLRSAANGFREPGGELLDGNADGTVGDDYSTTFTVASPPSDEVVVSIPDFARGYGQAVNLPRTTDAGIPVTLSTGQNVSRGQFDLMYDPALLTISGFTTGVPGATPTYEPLAPGLARFTVDSATEFSSAAGSITVGRIAATVPDMAPYASKQVLDLTNLAVLDASPGTRLARPARDDDGVHVTAFFGDTTGNAAYSGSDVTLLQRVVVGSASGFAAYQLADPGLIADLNSSGTINGSDVTFLQRVIVGTPVSFVPALPTGLPAVPAGGPDPRLWIPTDLRGAAGQTVTVPVNLTMTEPTGITLSSVDLVIECDAERFTVESVRLGTLLTEPLTPGPSPRRTGARGERGLVLSPALTNADTDTVDGLFTELSPLEDVLTDLADDVGSAWQ